MNNDIIHNLQVKMLLSRCLQKVRVISYGYLLAHSYSEFNVLLTTTKFGWHSLVKTWASWTSTCAKAILLKLLFTLIIQRVDLGYWGIWLIVEIINVDKSLVDLFIQIKKWKKGKMYTPPLNFLSTIPKSQVRWMFG